VNTDRAVRPYTTLPEPYALASLLVWLALTVSAWTVVEGSELMLRCLVYGALLSGAAVHSWFIVRTQLWARETLAGLASIGWMIAVAGITVLVEGGGPAPWIGMIAVLQITLCSFLINAATIRLSLLGTFTTLVAITPRLSIFAGGIAWVGFATLSMFLLAYDRTARAMGSLEFRRGEPRQTSRRVALVSAVALATAIFFFVTPLLAMLDLRPYLPSLPRRSFGSRPGTPSAPRESPGEQAEERGLGYGFGETTSTLRAALSDVKVMRLVTNPSVTGPLYVRGQSFDTFDGIDWRNSAHALTRVDIASQRPAELPFRAVSDGSPKSAEKLGQTYQMLTSLDEIVFTVGRPYSVQFSRVDVSAVWASDDQVLRIGGIHPAGSSYTVYSTNEIYSDKDLLLRSRGASLAGTNDLQIPNHHDRVASLAQRVVGNETSAYGKALALERYLRTKYKYALDHQVVGPQVVNDFLFDEKEGHCALFASAMVIMLRSVNVPARYVTGFLAHDPASDGSFTITGRDGHAWVEAFVPGTGWISFDPTAAAANASGGGTQMAGTRREAQPPPQPPPGASDIGGLYGREDAGQAGGGPGGQLDRGDLGGEDEPEIAGGQRWEGGEGGPGDNPRDLSTGAPGDGEGDAGLANGEQPDLILPPGGDTGIGGQRREGGSAGQGQNGGRAGSPPRQDDRASRASAARQPEKKPVVKDPVRDASDWRWLVAALAIVGTLGLGSFAVWQRGVGPAVESARVRRAVPLTIEEDPDPRRFVEKLYAAMTNGLGLVGMRKRASDTPGEYAEAVARRDPDVGRPVSELSSLFEVARYSDLPVTADDAARARTAWTSVATVVRKSRVDEAAEDE
jgi:transglutaminase-like putative cysteine protease